MIIKAGDLFFCIETSWTVKKGHLVMAEREMYVNDGWFLRHYVKVN